LVGRSLEQKGKGRRGGLGSTHSRERERVGALGASTQRREKKGGFGCGRHGVERRLWHMAVDRGRQPEGGGVGSRTGEAGEGREGAGS
jgi:hypothetical protein